MSNSAAPWTVCRPTDSSVYGIFQARIPEWVAISFSRASSWPRKMGEPVSPPLQADSSPTKSLPKPVGEPQLWRPNKCSRYISFYFFGCKWQIHIQTGLNNQEILLVYINKKISKEGFRDGLIRILFCILAVLLALLSFLWASY